ncbi:beta-ketoacyl-[acyl-carrier-protein] synthase II, partial [Vibrio cholerae]
MMNSHSSFPIFIHDCGFHSAMGREAAQIHHALASGQCAHMLRDDEILNTGTSTIIGRVTETLPDVPATLARHD